MNNQKISNIVKQQLPQFVQADYPKFIAFLKAYYEFLESSTQANNRIYNIKSLQDIDSTEADFIVHLKRQFMESFPNVQESNTALLMKNIKDFYLARGTKKSYEFLFRVLFNKEIELYYPNQDLLKVSDSHYVTENYINVIPTDGDYTELVGKKIVGHTSGATAVLYSATVNDYQYSGESVITFNIKDLSGTFSANEIISSDSVDGVSVTSVYSIKNFTINNPGQGLIEGDKVTITGPAGSVGANVRIKSVSRGPITDLVIDNAGYGYSVGDRLVFDDTNTDGSGASGYISSVSSTGAITSLKMSSGGNNYKRFPTVVVDPNSNGTGAEISLKGVDIGKIREFDVISNGAGYSSASVSFNSLYDQIYVEETPSITVNVGANYQKTFFSEFNSHLIAEKRIQDSDYWQLFSYDIIVEKSVKEYIKVVKSLVHPAGLKLFGTYRTEKTLQHDVEIQNNNGTSLDDVVFSPNENGNSAEITSTTQYLDAIKYYYSFLEDSEVTSKLRLGPTNQSLDDNKFTFKPYDTFKQNLLSPNSNYWINPNTNLYSLDNVSNATISSIVDYPGKQNNIVPDADFEISKVNRIVLKDQNIHNSYSGVVITQTMGLSMVELDDTASPIDNFYNNHTLYVYDEDGELVEQVKIYSYDGDSRVLTLETSLLNALTVGNTIEIKSVYNSTTDTFITIDADTDAVIENNTGTTDYLRVHKESFVSRKLHPQISQSTSGYGKSVSMSGVYLAVGRPEYDEGVSGTNGQVEIFKKTGTQWQWVETIDNPYPLNSAKFGCSVSFDGDYLAIGASGKKAVYVYKRDAVSPYTSSSSGSASETFVLVDIISYANGDITSNETGFGTQVSLSDYYLAVTSSTNTHIFRRMHRDDDLEIHDLYRFMEVFDFADENSPYTNATGNISLHGRFLAVATSGSTYIYERKPNPLLPSFVSASVSSSSSSTSEDTRTTAKFTFSVGLVGANKGKVLDINIIDGGSGYCVNDIFEIPHNTGISGTTATFEVDSVDSNGRITAVTITDAGTNYQNPYWIWNKTISTSGTATVCLNQSQLIIGESGVSTSTGQARIFNKDSGSTWTETQTIYASDASTNSKFGYSVAILDDYVAVSAAEKDRTYTNSGKVYIFKKSDGVWAEHINYVNTAEEASDYFGYSVCLSRSLQQTEPEDQTFLTEDERDLTTEDSYLVELEQQTDPQTLTRKIYYVSIGSLTTNSSYTNEGMVTVNELFLNQESKVTIKFDTKPLIYSAYGNELAPSASTISLSQMTTTQLSTLTVNDYYSLDAVPSSGVVSNNWNQITAIRSITSLDSFGSSVDISGRTLIAGSPSHNSSTGSAKVLTNTSTTNIRTWEDEQELADLIEDLESGDLFGNSVAIYGDYAVVGAPTESSRGKAYVFKNNDGVWELFQTLTSTDDNDQGRFGYSVVIDDKTIMIGAPNSSLAGKVYVYVLDSGLNGFKLTQTLQPKETSTDGDSFGYSISLNGQLAVVGSPSSVYSSGLAYIYEKPGTFWSETETLTPFDVEYSALFGYSVACCEGIVAVGCPQQDNLATSPSENTSSSSSSDNYGAVYVYNKTTDWNFNTKLLPSSYSSQKQQLFGISVAMSKRHLIVGAKDENYTNASSSSFSDLGLVYVYNRSCDSVTDDLVYEYNTVLVPDDLQASIRFGTAIAINDNIIIAGAPKEDNTLSSSSSATDAGSVYLFKLPVLIENATLTIYTKTKNVYEDDKLYLYKTSTTWEESQSSSSSGNTDLTLVHKLATINNIEEPNLNATYSGSNHFLFDDNCDLQFLVDWALDDSDNNGFVIVADSNNKTMKGTEFYSSNVNPVCLRPELTVDVITSNRSI